MRRDADGQRELEVVLRGPERSDALVFVVKEGTTWYDKRGDNFEARPLPPCPPKWGPPAVLLSLAAPLAQSPRQPGHLPGLSCRVFIKKAGIQVRDDHAAQPRWAVCTSLVPAGYRECTQCSREEPEPKAFTKARASEMPRMFDDWVQVALKEGAQDGHERREVPEPPAELCGIWACEAAPPAMVDALPLPALPYELTLRLLATAAVGAAPSFPGAWKVARYARG